MRCACCGEERASLAALQCADDVRLCAGCVGWLRAKLGVVDVTPILPVLDMDEAVGFYRSAGFDVHVYRDDQEDGEFAFVSYEDETVLNLGLAPAAAGAGCFLNVPDADVWHARLTERGCEVSPLRDEPWGMREFAVLDPSGNRLRFGHHLG